MQTVAAVCSSPGDFLRRRPSPVNRQASFLPLSSPSRNFEGLVSKSDNKSSRFSRVVVASSADGFDVFETKGSSISSSSKDSLLMSLIQEIEPLDVSLIQKDVTNETIDAMKRTISGMLGLLPSDQFHVVVEAMWDPLFKLLVSSMMTGYTLRNAEYRLSFERNLDLSTEDSKREEDSDNNKISREINTQNNSEISRKDDFENKNNENNLNFEGLGEISEETKDYIIHLQSRLNSMKKELYDLKRKNSALQMQQFVGEEKNDLLDYLRSLKPEKVAELSEPTCAGVQEAIHSVAHGLLATLSPKMQSSKSNNNNNIINNNNNNDINNNNSATLNLGKNDDDCTDLIEKISFKPQLFVPRDYLARLLFWCMLLGHYLRGLEYRLELTQLLTMGS